MSGEATDRISLGRVVEAPTPTEMVSVISCVGNHIVTELTKPPFAREVPRNEAEGVPLRFRSNFLFWNGSS